ncbi:MAG: helix-turn-helix transcriptional regulator [Methylococcales bacterium]|jgi:transcriptional regulator with XRE-family HTH domain|nr:helix-turn-helix transcriptional regulator [Methylococcales bacterium]
MTTPTNKINDRITLIRKYKLLNQKTFSEITGVARSTLSEVESGKNRPSSELIAGIANAFNDINIEWLLTGKDEMLKFDINGMSKVEQILELVEPLNDNRKDELLRTIIEKRRIYEIEDFVTQLIQRNVV